MRDEASIIGGVNAVLPIVGAISPAAGAAVAAIQLLESIVTEYRKRYIDALPFTDAEKAELLTYLSTPRGA
jgi:hypothetical protein